MLKGYSTPRSPLGRANLVGPPPWHYVGDMLVIEYWADAEAAAAVLPPPLEPHPDGGRAAAMFIDWQSCGRDRDELTDPSRSQYK
ncbi:MAG: acetoacetate decarboxylase family protein, partial [Solirubrobacterales bacterium]